jgi:hypothetical protein
MAKAFEVPLSAQPQQFDIALAGQTYKLRLAWNEASACWTLDIADSAGTPLLQGAPIVTGVDLLSQYGYLGIGGSLIVQTDMNPNAVPTFDDLGTTGRLYFITAD